MSTKWILINVLLVAVCGGLSWQLRNAAERFRTENQIARLQPRDPKSKSGQEPAPAGPPAPKQYVAADFDVVPAKNLFSEFRAREEKSETPVVVETPPLAVKPLLVGITILGNRRFAAIVDPSNQSAGRKTQTKKLGDSYMGYVVTDITENTMVLESGTRREVIPLYDTAKRGQSGGKTPIVATRVVNFGAGSGGGGPVQTAVASPAPTPPPGQARRAVVDGPAPTQSVGGSSVVGTSSGAVRVAPGGQPTVPGRTTSAPQSQNPAWNEGVDSQGRRVIRTPFGDIVRDKPPSP